LCRNGVLGLSEARRIRQITPDGNFAFVEGQNGAVPVGELLKEDAPVASSKSPLGATGFQAAQLLSKTHMQEFVVPLSNENRAIFQWPALLTQEDIDDLKDSLKILERKITRPASIPSKPIDEAAE